MRWNNQEDRLLTILRPCMRVEDLSKVFESLGIFRTAEAIDHRARKLKVYFSHQSMPPMRLLSPAEQNAVMQVTRTTEAPYSAIPWPSLLIHKKVGPADRLRAIQSIYDELQEIRETVPKVASISTTRASSGTSICLIMGDIHFGQKVIDPEIGVVSYDTIIAEQRIRETPQKVLAQIPPDDSIEEIVVFLLGDIVDGEGIFPHQEMTIEAHAAAQTLACTKSFWHMLTSLRDIYQKPVRVVTVRGNHGRTNASPEANWDNIVYQQLELLADISADESPMISIKNRYGEYNTAVVQGWNCMIRHHAPVQAETPAASAKFAAWATHHNWDCFMYGHYHHWGVMTYMGKPIFRCGSLVGGNDYAESLAKHDSPVQLLVTISRSKLPGTIRLLTY